MESAAIDEAEAINPAIPAAALRPAHRYVLRDGTTTKSIGLELMRAIGLDV